MPNAYGWRPGIPDKRDKYFTFSRKRLKALPPRHERLSGFPKIWDQGQLGSCTAHGILRARNFAAAKAGMKDEMLSRLQLYYDERSDEGTVLSDAGAMIKTGIKSLVKRGVGLESQWPYEELRYSQKPPNECYVSGLEHQALKYAAVLPVIDQIKAALDSGFPVVFGFTCYESLEHPSTAKSGLIPIPRRGDRVVGGHCVVFNGFWDDSLQLFGIDNSWGTGWGINGLGYLPYWFVQSGQVSDCWVLYEVEGRLPEPEPLPTPAPLDSSSWLKYIHFPARAGDWLSVGP